MQRGKLARSHTAARLLHNGYETAAYDVTTLLDAKRSTVPPDLVRAAPMNLRKTVDNQRGVYRIFETDPGVFHVLDSEGRTVDRFDIVDTASDRGTMKRAFRRGPRRPGAPDLAIRFVTELNAARLRH